MTRAALCVAVAVLLGGCNATTRGSALSHVPNTQPGLFLSTGGAPGPYTTLGFVQVRGYGVQVAGFAEAGFATLDGPVRGTLATEAARLGGNAVIHIEFLDENPSTEYEKMEAAAQSIQNFRTGGGAQTKDRYVTVTGEVVRLEVAR